MCPRVRGDAYSKWSEVAVKCIAILTNHAAGRIIVTAQLGKPEKAATKAGGGLVNWEYIHLISHPFPIVLTIVGAGVGLVGWATGRESLERYGLVSFLIAAVMAIPSYISGITAADVVVDRTFVRPGIVQEHRTWATWASIVLVTSGIFAVFSMTQPQDGRLRRFVLLLGLGAAALTGFASFRGGKIVHGEDVERTPVIEQEAYMPTSGRNPA